jgi:hypothetical protein
MKSILLFLAAAAVTAAPATADPLPHANLNLAGFREATLADFDGTPGAAARRADPNGLLAASGDFNGDGRTDEARILLNEAEGSAYVVAAIATAGEAETHLLLSMTLSEAADVAIRLAPAKAPESNPGIALFTFTDGESGGIRMDFDGDMFRDSLPD